VQDEARPDLAPAFRAIQELAAGIDDLPLRDSLTRLADACSSHADAGLGPSHVRWQVLVEKLLEDLSRREAALRRPILELREELASRWSQLDLDTRRSWLQALGLAFERHRHGQRSVDETLATITTIRDYLLAFSSAEIRG
jgi:hypothetical protein